MAEPVEKLVNGAALPRKRLRRNSGHEPDAAGYGSLEKATLVIGMALSG